MTTNKSVTVDNLGIPVSSRYARDVSQLDSKILKDLNMMAGKAEVPTITPFKSSGFDLALSSQVGWASFTPPPNALIAARNVFTHDLIPSLGDAERLQSLIDHFETLRKTLDKTDEKNCSSIIECLETVKNYNRMFELIQGRLKQYMKG